MLTRLRSLLSVLRSRRDFERNMAEELRSHIEQCTDDLVRSGVARTEAERRARLEFGGVNTVQAECREARWLNPFDELMRQVRYAARLLRKTPGFTLTALLTLGVCVGANLTIFAVINAVLLRPLPFADSERLVTIFNTYPKAGVERDGSSITNYYERRGRIAAFSGLALYRDTTAIVGEPGLTERQEISRVSPEFFATLGVGPVIGRGFTEEETTPQTDKEVVLTDSYWRQHFNGEREVIGKLVRVNGTAATVVGVLPPNFRFLSSKAQLYFPFSSAMEQRGPLERHSGGNSRQLLARLQPGATAAQAQAQIDAQNAALEVDDPQGKMMADAGFRSLVIPLHADHVASVRPVLLLLQAGAFTLLLIGAANLVNLLLIRANSRVKETAVRQALGASRWHLVSEVTVETTLLTLMGGLVGLGVGAAGIRFLATLGADRLPLGNQIVFDARLAGVALVGSLALGVLVAMPIAWFALRREVAHTIRSEARGGSASHTAQRLRNGFVVAQIALTFVLLAGAGLLGLSLEHASSVSPGFRVDHVLTGQISLPWSTYKDWPARVAFNQTMLRDITRQPAVVAAGVINNLPFSGNSGKSATTVLGHVPKAGESARANYDFGVDGDYFTAMGFSLHEGRFLTGSDSQRESRVCVVDEDFARYYWPHDKAVGKRLFRGSDRLDEKQAFTVVGVVGAAKQVGPTESGAQGAVYYPYEFRTDDSLYLAVRTSLTPESFAATLRRVVRGIDPQVPVSDLVSMDTRVAESLSSQRSPALLAALFSGIALLLTAVGTYGVLSYAVALRRGEIGVRMALGAQPQHIRWQFLILAARLLVFGTALGIVGAWSGGQAMQSLLFHVSPIDLRVLVGVACVMTVVSFLACLVPSQRASRISPMEGLANQQ